MIPPNPPWKRGELELKSLFYKGDLGGSEFRVILIAFQASSYLLVVSIDNCSLIIDNCSLMKVGLIILAAGKASRMGKPKQLLTYQGSSLISHAVKIGLNSICKPLIVVLGAYTEQIKPEIDKLPVKIVENPHWKTGMSSSIRAGIAAIKESNPNLDAVIIALADQPLISEAVFDRLIQSYQETQNIIIASAYDDIVGVPALFNKTLFSELINLEGDKGAKALMRKYQDEMLAIAIPEAAIDIDTPDDYQKLSSS